MNQEDQEKSMDKKEIAEEEREKMLNAENTKHTVASTVPEMESEDQKPKKKIPIGGIKMPGFYRTKSKELCKVIEITLKTFFCFLIVYSIISKIIIFLIDFIFLI